MTRLGDASQILWQCFDSKDVKSIAQLLQTQRMANMITHLTLGADNFHWLHSYEWKKIRSITFENMANKFVILPEYAKHLELVFRNCTGIKFANPWKCSISKLVLYYTSHEGILEQCPELKTLEIETKSRDVTLTIPATCTKVRIIYPQLFIFAFMKKTTLTLHGQAELTELEMKGWTDVSVHLGSQMLETLVFDAKRFSFTEMSFDQLRNLHCPQAFLSSCSLLNVESLSIVRNQSRLDLSTFPSLQKVNVEVRNSLKICNSTLKELSLTYFDHCSPVSLLLSNLSVSNFQICRLPNPFVDYEDLLRFTRQELKTLIHSVQSKIRMVQVQLHHVWMEQFEHRHFSIEEDVETTFGKQVNDEFGKFVRTMVDQWMETSHKDSVIPEDMFEMASLDTELDKEHEEKGCQLLKAMKDLPNNGNIAKKQRRLLACFKVLHATQQKNTRLSQEIEALQKQYKRGVTHFQEVTEPQMHCIVNCEDNVLHNAIQSHERACSMHFQQWKEIYELHRTLSMIQEAQTKMMETYRSVSDNLRSVIADLEQSLLK